MCSSDLTNPYDPGEVMNSFRGALGRLCMRLLRRRPLDELHKVRGISSVILRVMPVQFSGEFVAMMVDKLTEAATEAALQEHASLTWKLARAKFVLNRIGWRMPENTGDFE